MKFGLSQVIESHRKDVRAVSRSLIDRFSSKYERRLLALCKNNPDNDVDTKKWNKTAVKFLVNKFKKNTVIIEELEKAILLECSSTKCVPYPKGPDNRLLVSHRRGLPQVIYCRLWRWPDLQSHHQIKAIQSCDNYVDGTSGTVCVNPYHYDRKQPGSVDPVLVPCFQIPPDLSTSFEDSDPNSARNNLRRTMLPTTITGETVRSLLLPDAPNSIQEPETTAHPFQFKKNKFSTQGPIGHNSMDHQTSYDINGYATYNQQAPVQYQQQQPQMGFQPKSQYVHQQNSYPAQQMSSPLSPPFIQQQQQQQQQQVNQLQHQTYGTGYSPQQEQYQPQEQYVNQDRYMQSDHMQLDYNQEVSMSSRYQPDVYYEPVAGPSRNYDPQPMQEQPPMNYQRIPYVEGSRWCTISYHELDQRVGDKFQPTNFTVSVDGYTNPNCSDRFCVGRLTNLHRDEIIEWVRRRIGRGVKFTYVDGEVYLECSSDSSIFVSSPMIHDSVTKVTSGSTLKVFSNSQFSKLLSEAIPKGFEDVYKLTTYCTLRVSFLKGWGRNYKRQTILEVPCWVEVQLNGPFQWIDEVLRQMRPPQACGSTS